ALLPPPNGVRRRFEFAGGVVPEEYSWAVADSGLWDEGREGEPLVGEQCVPIDTWLRMISTESASEGGHAGPTGEGNYEIENSAESAECRCPACEVVREAKYFA